MIIKLHHEQIFLEFFDSKSDGLLRMLKYYRTEVRYSSENQFKMGFMSCISMPPYLPAVLWTACPEWPTLSGEYGYRYSSRHPVKIQF
ncbi:hypothetical protein CDAR_126531 [Caerostris darwini]|uniref:Uncharacterized protein n=1 Tax=Caerostris darwini TaxID=1538125 RepID=A0AAV4R3R8_9ARAC|nr:hypothetical protein CDAR_126531 [Caerostris darwini]